MQLKLHRFISAGVHTLGSLHLGNAGVVCFTLEDPIRKVKIPHETAIPTGKYKIVVRRAGNMVKRYDKNYTHIHHDGMLMLEDVPNYEWVYIHVGNSVADTSGCLLVGESVNYMGTLGSSRAAYTSIYPAIHAAADKKECTIQIVDKF